MSWFPDMGTESMIDTGGHVRAVGWLSAAHPFPCGDVPSEFMSRLKEFAGHWGDSTEVLGWAIAMGPHCCELCGGFMASGNFGVPSGALLFAAPEMIAHYVEVHQYRPPEQFIAAVLRSTLPGTKEYEAAVEPFRQLHEQREERALQERIEYAGQWASQHGATDEAVRDASLRFFCDPSPAMCERIRRAMAAD